MILDNVKVRAEWRRLRMLVCFLPSSDCIHKSGEREREREREKERHSVTTQIALKQRLSFTLRAGDGRHVINTK